MRIAPCNFSRYHIAMNTIAQALNDVWMRKNQAALSAGRDPAEIRVLLATKRVEADRICQAIAAGADLIGENRVQEALEKQEALAPYFGNADEKTQPDRPKLEQHFIGHLQSNKIKDMLSYAQMLHSLDRISLAEKLETILEQHNRDFPVLIQVNTSQEESKFGLMPDEVMDFVQHVLDLPRLQLKGFMTIGLNSSNSEAVRESYRKLRILRNEAQQQFSVSLPELSMGMSGDFELAIAEGATIIRPGSAVFGYRG